ncbi:chemotaxis protein CheB [Actinoplanes sp. NPDC051343]|uniref:chemotaxis protein CheB n=1 Tax=Actinoplanes sp. NPDC051343 TaxID=3363906 RepID=UPI00379A27E4
MSGRFPVIMLVCSAGGLEALGAVLGRLPENLPAAVVALQHLEPDRASQLPMLLDRYTALTVAPATDGDALTPGRVLIAPPGQHTLIAVDASIALIPSGSLPPYRPSADLLLTTAAIALTTRLIAVVLTGRGNDGATGATAVHRFGGTVIVSSLDSSTQQAMPEATIGRDHVAGHVVPLSDVPILLQELVTAPLITPARKPTTDDD